MIKTRICCTTCPNECELDVEMNEKKEIASVTVEGIEIPVK